MPPSQTPGEPAAPNVVQPNVITPTANITEPPVATVPPSASADPQAVAASPATSVSSAEPAAQTVQPQAPAASLNVEALRAYEQAWASTSTWQAFMADSSLKRQIIIAVVLSLTIVLVFVGVIIAIRVFLKASAQAKAQREAANQAIFQNFAQQNGLQLVAAGSVPASEHQTFLEQCEVGQATLMANAPQALSGFGVVHEPAVTGSLPGGLPFTLQIKHASFAVTEDNPDSLIVDRSPFKIKGGIGISTGTALDSAATNMRSFKSFKNDSTFYDVTINSSSSTITSGKEAHVSAEYVYQTLSVNVGQLTMPHILLVPVKGEFCLPILPQDPYQLKLEGDFNQYFGVYAPKGYETEVLQLLEPNVMQALMADASDVSIEFVGNRVTFSLALRPYVTQKTLADATARLHALAVKFEPWLKKEFATWRFQPQPAPFDLVAGQVDKFAVIRQLEQVDSSHIAWTDNTMSDGVSQQNTGGVGSIDSA